jgi:hypothetical protein
MAEVTMPLTQQSLIFRFSRGFISILKPIDCHSQNV